MKWNRYRIKTTTQAVDMISWELSELGIEGIQIEDKIPLTQEEKSQMFIDILPELGEDDGVAFVSFFIEPEKDTSELMESVREALEGIRDFVDAGELTIEKSETADEDWINNWKQFWKPFDVDSEIMVKPTWEVLPEGSEGKLIIELDPGTSFGTGTHHTTRLCITQLKKYIKSWYEDKFLRVPAPTDSPEDVAKMSASGPEVLDVGSGSGILSIIAMKLGALEAVATDIDPAAVEATLENAQVNSLDMDRFYAMKGDMITDPDFRMRVGISGFDIVVANILAEIIVPLTRVIGENLRPGGIFISSGILTEKEDMVIKALEEEGFEVLEVTRSGEWSGITAKNASAEGAHAKIFC